MAGLLHLEGANVLEEKENMESIFFFCMSVRALHKLEDGFSHQRPNESMLAVAEVLQVVCWLSHKNATKPLSLIFISEMCYRGKTPL